MDWACWRSNIQLPKQQNIFYKILIFQIVIKKHDYMEKCHIYGKVLLRIFRQVSLVFNRLHRSKKYVGAVDQHFQVGGRSRPSRGPLGGRGLAAWEWEGGGPFKVKALQTKSNPYQNPDLGTAGFDGSGLDFVWFLPGPSPSQRPTRLSRSIPDVTVLSHSSNILFRAVESIENQRNPTA